MAEQSPITVQTFKYDGKPHRNWKCDVIERKDNLLVLLGIFDREITHSHLGTIKPGTLSYEYYWLDRWYNVFRFHEPDGSFRNFYCNINMPPKFENGRLEYVDLDIDIYVSNSFEMAVWDMDEFEQNRQQFDYPDEVVKKAIQAVDELTEMAVNKSFPFSVK